MVTNDEEKEKVGKAKTNNSPCHVQLTLQCQ